MDYLIETREIGDYRIKVYQDESAECPCSAWDLAGVHIWEYPDSHRLHRDCDIEELFGKYGDGNHDMEESLKRLVCEYVTQEKIIDYINSDNVDNYRMRYDKSDHMWYLENLYDGKWYTHEQFDPSDLKNFDYREELCDILGEDDFKSLLHDCKNIAFYEWSSSGYCQGDYVNGYAYCDKERFSKMCDTDTKNWRKRALDIFESEVKSIGLWMWGDVKGYVLEKKVPYKKIYTEIGREPEDGYDWEEVDSCWGCFMDTSELVDEVVDKNGIQRKDAA